MDVTSQSAEPVAILRWIFLLGRKVLTCEIRFNGPGSFDICVVPHWDVSASVVEWHDDLASALRRHAEIGRHFREAGWLLVRQTGRQADMAA